MYKRQLLAEHSTAIDNDYKALKQQQQFILNSTECENNDQLLAEDVYKRQLFHHFAIANQEN